jgi:hypothetical protein
MKKQIPPVEFNAIFNKIEIGSSIEVSALLLDCAHSLRVLLGAIGHAVAKAA